MEDFMFFVFDDKHPARFPAGRINGRHDGVIKYEVRNRDA
jgi:hypothetical protein